MNALFRAIGEVIGHLLTDTMWETFHHASGRAALLMTAIAAAVSVVVICVVPPPARVTMLAIVGGTVLFMVVWTYVQFANDREEEAFAKELKTGNENRRRRNHEAKVGPAVYDRTK